VLEKRVLGGEGIERALEAPNADEAMRVLTQSSAYDFSQIKIAASYEDALKNALPDLYKQAYSMAGENRIVVDVLSHRYDFHNIKVALKATLAGGDDDPSRIFVSVTGVDPQDILAYVRQQQRAFEIAAESTDDEVSFEFMQKTEEVDRHGLDEYITGTVDRLIAGFAENEDPQAIDLGADAAMFAHQLELAGEAQVEFITDYVKKSIDYHNLKALLRAKNMGKPASFLDSSLVEGGFYPTSELAALHEKELDELAVELRNAYFSSALSDGMRTYQSRQNFSGLEKQLDDAQVRAIKEAKYVAFGPELLFAYVLNKENELRQVRLVMAGKVNGLTSDIIRERLRENYA